MVLILKKNYLSNLSGFTLLELLLSLSVMVILAGISIPIAWPFVTQNELDVSSVVTAQTIRRAQSLAMSMQEDSPWGVRIDAQSVTLFKGENYDSRNSEFDEFFSLSHIVSITGFTEVYFTKLTGLPNNYGEIIMTNNQQQSKSIFLSAHGVISN